MRRARLHCADRADEPLNFRTDDRALRQGVINRRRADIGACCQTAQSFVLDMRYGSDILLTHPGASMYGETNRDTSYNLRGGGGGKNMR